MLTMTTRKLEPTMYASVFAWMGFFFAYVIVAHMKIFASQLKKKQFQMQAKHRVIVKVSRRK